MQSPCYRCGTPVEDGSAFCPSCNAPQIKVSGSQPPANEPFVPPPDSSAPDVLSAQALPVSFSQTGAIQWKRYRRLALPLSLLAGVGIPLSPPLGLLFFVGSIIYTVARYRRDHQGFLSPLQGAKMGAFNGFISFVTIGVLRATLGFREQLIKQLAGNPDPQAQQLWRWVSTTQGFVMFVVLSLVVFLIVSSFIGAVSVAFSANRERR